MTITKITPLLEIKNLTLGFQFEKQQHVAVKNVNFFINHGETLALVGESGGGKSLTGLAIMQLLPPAARVDNDSKILFDQQDLLQLSEVAMQHVRGKRIAMIFQEPMTAFNPVLTIGQQIGEVIKKHFKLAKKERQQQILHWLDEVGIANPARVAASYPHQLSGGMRQRAMIALALAGQPDLLIADEPTTSLDVTLQAQILTLLKQLQKKFGMSLLFITHDLGIVGMMADSVAVIYQGEIVEQQTTTDFFHRPQSDYSRKLFAALPSWETRIKPLTQTPTTPPLLEANNVKIYFPIRKGIFKRTVDYVKAVDDIDLNLYTGRTLALIGESGSGKTTLAKGMLGLLKITAGNVTLDQQDLSKLSNKQWRRLRQQLQIVFQDPYAAMDPRMLVVDIIAEGMHAQKLITSSTQMHQRIDELLQLVGLSPASKWRYPHEFSGGQRQRICIARSLAVDPKIIICDEPTSALDVSAQMQILKLLQDLQQQLKLTYLLITHNFAVVNYLADEVAVMHHGKIVEYGPVANVLQSPQHQYTQKLLASVPTLK